MVKRWNRSWIVNYRESYSYILNAPLIAPSTPMLPVSNFGDNQQVLRERVSGVDRCLPKALTIIIITFYPSKKESRRLRLHNYIDERNRKNRRSEAKVFDENKDENFDETAIIAMKDVFAIVDEEVEVNAMIEMTIKDFRNTISIAEKYSFDNDEMISVKFFDERR